MDILTGINEKNNAAYNLFFKDFFSSLVMFTDKYVHDMEESADIAQECFVRLYTGEQAFASLDKVKSYLYVTAYHLALNHLEHTSIEDFYIKDIQKNAETTIVDNIMEEEIYASIYHAIGQLAPQSKKIIQLAMKGLTNSEIADILGISPNTVKTLKQNAYKKLKVLLKDRFCYLFLFMVTQYASDFYQQV